MNTRLSFGAPDDGGRANQSNETGDGAASDFVVSMVGVDKDINVEFGQKWFRKAWVNIFGEMRTLVPKVFLECHSFEVGGDGRRTWIDEVATLGVFSEVTHELASKL